MDNQHFYPMLFLSDLELLLTRLYPIFLTVYKYDAWLLC